MSSIYVYSPSGAVNDKPAFQCASRFLTQQGHRVEIDPAALQRAQRFAGDDAVRLTAIARAAGSRADVALIARGGYGLTRLLPKLPYRTIQRSIDRGMAWVGFSDFTAFQLAVLSRTGGITWSGPSLCDSFGKSPVDDITWACFDDLMQRRGYGVGWRMTPANARALPAPQSRVWARNAVLWGGNLCTVCSLLGTDYFPQIRGGVLFLEDVGEHPYRIERMLTQLLYAGVLQRQKAIVLGQFTNYQLVPHDRGFGMTSVVQWLRTQIKRPVLTDLPFGHVPTRVCLPVGAKVDLQVDGREALLTWGHV